MSVIRIDKDDSPKKDQQSNALNNADQESKDKGLDGAKASEGDLKNSNNKTIEIVVDGPLGYMYTKALAAIYAKESMMNEAVVDSQTNEEPKKDPQELNTNLTIVDAPNTDNVAHAYIYAIKGEDLANKNTSEVTNKLRVALDKQKANSKYIAIEDDNRNPKLFDSISLVLEATGAVLIRNKQRLSRVFK